MKKGCVYILKIINNNEVYVTIIIHFKTLIDVVKPDERTSEWKRMNDFKKGERGLERRESVRTLVN